MGVGERVAALLQKPGLLRVIAAVALNMVMLLELRWGV